MSVEKKEVLLEVKINSNTTEEKINGISKSITVLTAETKDLIEVNKTLEKSGDVLTSQYVENTKQIEINKNKIAGETAERKTLIKALELEDNSLGALKASSKDLAKEREGLNLKTKEGKDRLIEINKQLDENKDKTKDVTTAGKGWASQIDSVIPGFKGMVDGLSATTKAGLAFIATPLGATLAVIAAGLALVYKFFTSTEAGGDLLAKRMAQLDAIFNILVDRAAALGGALVKLFTGDFIGAAEDASNAVSGVGDEMTREIKIAGELADILDELGNRELDYKVLVSGTQNEIKKLIIESKNRTLSEEERIQKLQKATQIEIDNNEIIKQINLDKVRYAVEQLKLNNSQLDLQIKKDETELQYAVRLSQMREVKFEDLQALGDAIIVLNETEGESLNLQAKTAEQIDILNEKREAEIQKIQEAAQKKKEAEQKETADYNAAVADRFRIQQESIKKYNEAEDKKEADAEKRRNTSLSNLSKYFDEVLKATDKSIKETGDSKKKQDEEDEKAAAIRMANFLDAAQATLDVTSDIFAKRNAIIQGSYKNEIDQLTIAKNASIDATTEKYDLELAELNKQRAAGIVTEEQYAARLKKIDKDEKDDKAKIQKDFESSSMDIKRKAFEANKKNQIIQTEIDVAQAGIGAFRALAPIPLVGPVLAAAAAIAAIAYGKRQVDIIKASQFVGAEGGEVPGKWKTLGGERHNGSRKRGTQFVGSDGTTFLAEKDEGLFILKRDAHSNFIESMSRRNMRFGGRSWTGRSAVSYADLGGRISGSSASSFSNGVTADQVVDIVEATVSSMPRPVVLVETINSVQQEVIDVDSKGNLA